MRRRSKILIAIVSVVGGLIGAALLFVAFALPAIVRTKVAGAYGGRVEIDSVQLGFRWSNLKGIRLYEGQGGESSPWLSVDSAKIDAAVFAELFGSNPSRSVHLKGVSARLRLDAQGSPLTKFPKRAKPSTAATKLPALDLSESSVEIEQAGRSKLTIRGIEASAMESANGIEFRFSTTEPSWGGVSFTGQLASDFKTAKVQGSTKTDLDVTPAWIESLPFIPAEVWKIVVPEGKLGANFLMTYNEAAVPSAGYQITLESHGASIRLPSIEIISTASTGVVRVDGHSARLLKIVGNTLGGRIEATGLVEWGGRVPEVDLNLSLNAIEVTKAPKSWQLDEVGATGRLTGQAHLVASFPSEGADLTGSSGRAVIEGGTLQGFPVKSLRLSMRGDKQDLQYSDEAEKKGEGAKDRLNSIFPPFRQISSETSLMVSTLIALQGPQAPDLKPAPAPKPAPDPKPATKLELPRSLTTHVEFEDVDLAEVVKRIETLTLIRLPIRLSGKASLKAKAKIPLGNARDLKGYTFEGQATLRGATIDGVDLGRVDASLDLRDGVLELSDFRGRLLDRPAGSELDPPQPTDPAPSKGELPPGGFRGTVRAEISPPGRFTARFEGNLLPLGELAAPLLSRPTPLSGKLSTNFDAESLVSKMDQPDAWHVSGKLDSESISYRTARLDQIVTRFGIIKGRVTLDDLTAKLLGSPLKANVSVGLTGDYDYTAQVEIKDWRIAKLLPFFPAIPSPSPIDAILSARADVKGTLLPLKIQTNGAAGLRAFTVEKVNLGDVSLDWRTEGDNVVIHKLEAHPLGGTLNAQARFPTTLTRPASITAEFSGIDLANASKSLNSGQFSASGVASGKLDLQVEPMTFRTVGQVSLNAPKLVVQGVPVGPLKIQIDAKGQEITYLATAAGSGTTRFSGTIPIDTKLAALPASVDAHALSVGYSVNELATLAGLKVSGSELKGVVGVDANLRLGLNDHHALGIHGILEARNLRWGDHYPLGKVRGILTRNPEFWQIDEIGGDLLGGPVSGLVRGDTAPAQPGLVRFDLHVDRALLSHVFAFLPDLSKQVTGFGSVRIEGRHDRTLAATAEIFVTKATVFAVPVSDLRVPAELLLEADGTNGTLHARRWTAKVAGGQVRGEAALRLGLDHSFNVVLDLTNIDVGTIARAQSTTAHPGSGRMSGRITLNGPDPKFPQKVKGRVDLTLDDASLVEVPILRGIDRFLGAARGGLIENGELHATIANRQLIVETLTMNGRLVQLHATGVIGFDGQVALEVLVNTNQVIPQTGQKLVSLIPGLKEAVGRREQSTLRVSSFLSNRLLKFRIGGTVKNPAVSIDPAVAVTSSAVGFFSGVLKLPLGIVR